MNDNAIKQQFTKAYPVWKTNPTNQWNQFIGFYVDLNFTTKTELQFKIAARSFYRLFINGEMAGHGPAQAAYGFSRVDIYSRTVSGDVRIAIEVAAYNKPDGYSNDITLEPGMLCCEVLTGGQVLAATGWGEGAEFYAKELDYREEMTELLSHCREIAEYYNLDSQSFSWRTRSTSDQGKAPQLLDAEIPVFLERRAPHSEYCRIPFERIVKTVDVIAPEQSDLKPKSGPELFMQARWYQMNPKRLGYLLHAEDDRFFTGQIKKDNGYQIIPGEYPTGIIWDLGVSVVGFPELTVEVTEDTVIDLYHSDLLDVQGKIEENNSVVRFSLAPGNYHLICFEAYLVRYMKVIFRTKGQVYLKDFQMIEYCHPDQRNGDFHCSDEQLNRIFEGAYRTLRQNTMDIFMDCPERERGGWLCDSLWISRAAWMMFGELDVERDFLENFLLTDPDRYQDAFFPEVYPGRHHEIDDPGLRSWSFWLALELCEYYERSGDRAFIDRFRYRIERFVDGAAGYIGEHGLLENLPALFVDWSDSNYHSNLYPISVPTNLLAAFTFESLAELYQRPDWTSLSEGINEALKTEPFMFMSEPVPQSFTDAVSFKDGQLMGGQGITEAGIGLELWPGWYQDPQRQKLLNAFIEHMGTCPAKPTYLQVAKANLFIGLCIRYDVLSKAGAVETMVRELKDIYIPQLLTGPGTLFEGVSSDGICTSRSHGINGHAGVLLMRDVLGIGEPKGLTNTVRIAPHPLEFNWAYGKATCRDGEIIVDWRIDRDEKQFYLSVKVPEGWKAEIEMPKELEGYQIIEKL